MPFVYVAGMWMAVVSRIAFTGVYALRVAEEARLLANALAATELVLQREQHLSALDGLAAAAAHELGTPLATIALVAKEMERALGEDPRYKEDVTLLRSQSERCREILKRLTSLSSESETPSDAAAADLADRGGDRAASRFRHRDHARARRAERSGAGRPAQSRRHLRTWQSGRERRRFRQVETSRVRWRWNEQAVALHDHRRRPGLSARNHRPHRRALYVDAPGQRSPAAAWASACSSPRRCWSVGRDDRRSAIRSERGEGAIVEIVWPRALIRELRRRFAESAVGCMALSCWTMAAFGDICPAGA